jgi:predicted RNA-binding protein YlqC (UPF0109 family)
MTAEPKAPGAAAIYLYREEITSDADQTISIYVRLKVLTEKGRDCANVSLEYGNRRDGFGFTITKLQGRTIHRDGTVIPFTGKPYQRVIKKSHDEKTMEEVFTLPDVEVGGILEYRYKLVLDGDWLSAPTWTIPQEYYTRKGYFLWMPLDHSVRNTARQKLSTGISWTQSLPPGVAVERTDKHSTIKLELNVHDIEPLPDEDYMPPVQSFTYTVDFYYSFDSTLDEFWKNEGAAWAKGEEEFIGKPGKMVEAVQSLVAPGDTDEVKLRKIYAAIMAMDNTRFSRKRSTAEDQAEKLKPAKSTLDIWQRKRGTDDQLTELFIALARAAGMKAYLMKVTSRRSNLFSSQWMSMSQLNDNVAIVVLDGKERYFDPGQRYSPFGQMMWIHSGVGGLREAPNNTTAIGTTAAIEYTATVTQRTAEVTLDSAGMAKGKVRITWIGSTALDWRQQYLREDEASVRLAMKEWLAGSIPLGMGVELTNIKGLTDYEQPLIADYEVHGQMASVTGKRLIFPGQFFEAQSKPKFASPTRSVAVYFHCGERVQDAVQIVFPRELKLESAPKKDSIILPQMAGYSVASEIHPNAIVMRRALDRAATYILVKEYSDARTFYSKLSVDDQQPVVLTRGGVQPGQ